jgi:hypothetical protein
MSKMALLQIGYHHYAVPLEDLSNALCMFERFRKVGQKYDGGYVYWFEADDKESDIGISIVAASSILDSEPAAKPEPAKPAPVQKAKDVRVLAAPSDEPIVIGPLPPLREFVNEHRDEESEAA